MTPHNAPQDYGKKQPTLEQRLDYASMLQDLYASISLPRTQGASYPRNFRNTVADQRTEEATRWTDRQAARKISDYLPGTQGRASYPRNLRNTVSDQRTGEETRWTDYQAAYKISDYVPRTQAQGLPQEASYYPENLRNKVATASKYRVSEDEVKKSHANQANYIVVSMCNMASLQHNLSRFSDTCATTLLWSGSAGNNTPLRLFNGQYKDPFYFGFTLDPTATRILFGAKEDFMSERKDPGHDTAKLGAVTRPWWSEGERDRYQAIESSKYGYTFGFILELSNNQPEEGKVYFEVNPNNKKQLKYIVLDPNGNKQEDYIELNKEITGELTTQYLYRLRRYILQRLLEKGHIHVEYKKHEKRGCITTDGGGTGDSNSFYTDYSRWSPNSEASRSKQAGILDGGTFHEKASWDIFAANMRRKYLKKAARMYTDSGENKAFPPYNEALVAPEGEQNPINGIMIPYENIEKISVQDLAKLINILQTNPKLKLFIYDKSLKEHIIREIKGEAAISLLNNRLKLTTEQIALLPPFSGETPDPTSSSLPTNGGPSRFRRY